MTKVCTKCGEEKALVDFSNRSAAKDGKQPKCKACVKKYREENKERISEQKREYHRANREHRLEYNREYRQANKERISEQKREWYQANKERRLEYNKERYASDPAYSLKERCRARIRYVLNRKGYFKDSTTAEMLGCTWEELAAHLESQFVDGMTWDNRSEWHIDHIVPLASVSTKEETAALNHYTNLQPLWAEDNLSKGARLDWAA